MSRIRDTVSRVKWQIGDQVWSVEGDGQQLRPVRIGVIGRALGIEPRPTWPPLDRR